MISLKTEGESNDIVIDNTSFAFVYDDDKILQAVKNRLKVFKGEWFLNLDSGVPYYQEIFTKPVNVGNVESILKQTVLETDGVQLLTFFETSFDGTSRDFKSQISFITENNTEITGEI